MCAGQEQAGTTGKRGKREREREREREKWTIIIITDKYLDLAAEVV